MLRAGSNSSVVLIDLHMPRLDGWGFRAEQARDPAPADRPVVLYSGHHDVAEAAHALGIRAYFSKPLNLAGLVEAIMTYRVER